MTARLHPFGKAFFVGACTAAAIKWHQHKNNAAYFGNEESFLVPSTQTSLTAGAIASTVHLATNKVPRSLLITALAMQALTLRSFAHTLKEVKEANRQRLTNL